MFSRLLVGIYIKKSSEVTLKTRSAPASLSFKGLVTMVYWPKETKMTSAVSQSHWKASGIDPVKVFTNYLSLRRADAFFDFCFSSREKSDALFSAGEKSVCSPQAKITSTPNTLVKSLMGSWQSLIGDFLETIYCVLQLSAEFLTFDIYSHFLNFFQYQPRLLNLKIIISSIFPTMTTKNGMNQYFGR